MPAHELRNQRTNDDAYKRPTLLPKEEERVTA